MRKIEVVRADQPFATGYALAPHCRLVGGARSRVESPPDASIWMGTALVDAGATLSWEPGHGEEAIFVERGELRLEGRICEAGGALVIEANARPTVSAQTESRIIHMGAHDAPSLPEGVVPHVHMVGPRGTFEAIEPGRETRFFADATCGTCSVWLLATSRSFAYESPIHSHSRDELIHVLRGEIRIGSLTVGPGSTVFIAADQLYHFRSSPEGFAFLNFRSAASQMTIRGQREKIIESGAATGMTRVADAFSH
jgi:quercetin dioxygenase-like cupin family protein